MSPTVQRWLPDPSPPDNRPGSPVRPHWHLLLDDPAPRRVLVVGRTTATVEAWIDGLGAEVVRADEPGHPGGPVDLIVVGAAQAAACLAPDGLWWLSLCCDGHGSAWIPTTRTARRDRRLRDHGFEVRRWDQPGRGAPPDLEAGVLLCRPGPADRPPTWLAEVGAGTGWDPATGSWTLRTPTAYPSQKSVAQLKPGPEGGTSAVVKVTQHPRFNERLDNEHDQLRTLWLEGGAAAGRAPMALAAARAGDLAVVVEERVAGRPFLEVSRLGPQCAYAADAAEAITELGRATRSWRSGSELAGPLGDLVDRYVTRHQPDLGVARFLHDQVELIGAAPRIPSVLVHGDLGTWNLVVADGSARVRVLDWESAAPAGPPLWDLSYFLRSFAVRSGRRRGRRRRSSLSRHLLHGSPLTEAFAGWVRSYRQALDLEPALLAPLFHTCWVHRAVKEAARLPDGTAGHYGPLCSELAAAHSSPGLRRLLAG